MAALHLSDNSETRVQGLDPSQGKTPSPDLSRDAMSRFLAFQQLHGGAPSVGSLASSSCSRRPTDAADALCALRLDSIQPNPIIVSLSMSLGGSLPLLPMRRRPAARLLPLLLLLLRFARDGAGAAKMAVPGSASYFGMAPPGPTAYWSDVLGDAPLPTEAPNPELVKRLSDPRTCGYEVAFGLYCMY